MYTTMARRGNGNARGHDRATFGPFPALKEVVMARLTRIAPELPASNLAEAVGFYERLGFALASRVAQDYAIVERDGIALHLFEDKQHRSAAMGVHLFTPELAEMYEEFAGRGVRF